VVDLSVFFSDCYAAMWAVLLSALSGIGAWLLRQRNMANLIEQLQVGAKTLNRRPPKTQSVQPSETC
jgi:hypothetical protein